MKEVMKERAMMKKREMGGDHEKEKGHMKESLKKIDLNERSWKRWKRTHERRDRKRYKLKVSEDS
jgi:hypothetical protein